MKKLLFAVLATATLAACTQEELVSINQGDAITFDNAFIDNATRAAIDGTYTTATLNEFEVYATITTPTDGVANIFEQEKVVKGGTGTGDAWTYDANNTQYWIEGNTYDFRAVAEGNVSGVTEAIADDNGLLTGVNLLDVTAQKDILFAEQMNVDYAGGAPEPVKFTFEHLMAKVKFTFKNSISTDNGYSYKVTNVKINETAKNGVYTVGTGWAEAASRVNTSLEFGNGAATSAEAGAEATAIGFNGSVESNWERLLVPSNEARNITFTTQLFKGGVLIDTKDRTVNSDVIKLEEGGAYNFVVSLGNPGEPIKFDVEKVNDWDETASLDYNYEVTTGSVIVNNANGLQTVMAGIAAGTIPSDVNIILGGDIDLSAPITRAAVESNWVPVGTEEKPFTGAFDGKGHTIKNLTIVESEAKEGKAYIGFFGYAKDVEIKNVIFENVTLNIPCLDIDHSQGHIGAVAGSLEGTSTIENVTVKGDIKVEATQGANGASRVAVVAGGNSYGNVTMKNVHVIANEGSYLIANNNTGALAGQLQGKNVFENCSSNIDVTVNKFFAGGIIGLAAGDSQFINCHTTGDIAVVAGREGRAHDQYRVGGIAGGWADNTKTPCVLKGCSYTGVISGKNSDGSVADPLDYAGYVGRGYTLAGCQGSRVIIDNVTYVQRGNTADTAGVYDIIYTENGEEITDIVSNVEELKEAVKAGETTLYLKAGTYDTKDFQFMNKTLTLKGVENGVKIYISQNNDVACTSFDSCTVTFENLTIETLGGIYKGFARMAGTYKNCTIVNNYFTFQGKHVFEGCTFDATAAGNEHCMWTYGAAEVEFVGCEFNYSDRCVNVYVDNGGNAPGITQAVKFTECEFNTENTDSQGAVEVNSSPFTAGVTVTLNDCDAPAYGELVYVSPWDGTNGKTATITVDGELKSIQGFGIVNGYYVLGNTVTVLNGEGFKTVATTILNDSKADVVVELANDIDLAGIEWPAVSAKATFVLDGKGNTIRNLTTSAVEEHGFSSTAMFTTTRKATTIKNLVVENATVTGNGKENSHGAVLVACNYAALTIQDVNVVDSTISNCDRTGGLLTYLYFTEATVDNCVVDGCTINSIGTAGAILGMNNSNNFTMTNCEVVDTTVSSSEGSNKAGILIGTWQDAGTLTSSGNTHENSKAINAGVETNNEIGRHA